jgi:hypothetical protein
MRRFPLVVGAMLAIAMIVPAVASARALVVTKKNVSYKHYRSIQSAVNAARSGDWVLIAPGTYTGPVKVTTDNLYIRGLDRNKVIVDGKHKRGVNGIEVLKADNVYVENLTVRNFDRDKRDGENGNQIWWNGGDGSGKIGAHGWYGQYLTTYDTGLIGGYGLFASNSVTGSLRHVYASGFNDSGLYIGACRDCKAKVSDALVERNALGYSGTNSGGNIVVEKSVFRNNSNGVGPNSLNNDDQPPPQDGACDSGKNRSATPTFPSTNIKRCTIFRDNLVENNNNFTTPANATLRQVPWGNGFVMVGTYADLVEGNTIRGNSSFGILGFENPDPFPPKAKTVFFQLAGNRFSGNTLEDNGAKVAQGADIGLLGGLFGQQLSVNNCFSGNAFSKSVPANIEGTWGCQNSTTPNPGSELLGTLLDLQAQSQVRKSRGQPAPPKQPTMPKPCKGVPRNPLC